MFKPKFGTCKCHNLERLIVVKAGLCKQGNEELKRAKKIKKVINLLKNALPPIKKLIKELDTEFSIFIRTREADENGETKCFTCSKVAHWKTMDCGHYESRSHKSLRWSEINCHVQCKGCNIFKKGNYPAYALKMQETYSEGVLERLHYTALARYKIDRSSLEFLIQKYKALNKLNNGKTTSRI